VQSSGLRIEKGTIERVVRDYSTVMSHTVPATRMSSTMAIMDLTRLLPFGRSDKTRRGSPSDDRAE
jgi:hypothetical protein